jgi:hypothetical protein
MRRFNFWERRRKREIGMKTQTLIALTATIFFAGASIASAAGMAQSGVQTSASAIATPNASNGERVAYYNQHGKTQKAPTQFAQIWGDASLGG